MDMFERFSKTVRVPQFISGLGLLLLIGYITWAVVFDSSATVVIIQFITVGIPSIILIYSGYWLKNSDIREDAYIHVARWCIISIGITNAILTLLAFAGGAESITEIFEDILLVTGWGGVGGFGIGVNQARAFTKANEAEEQNQTLKRYETLIKESTNVNAVLDTEGVFQYLTPSTKNVLGYSPSELEGKSSFSYVHPDDVQKTKKAFAEILETGEAGPIEFKFKHKDGSWAVLSGKGRNLLNDPTIGGIVVYTHEITERKQLETELKETVRKLEESNEELERFAYAASHDLKEPIRTVSGYLKILEQNYDVELSSDAEELVEKAIENSERMQEMIDDLLEYSRITTQDREFEKIDANTALDRALENLRTKIEENNAEIDKEDLPEIVGDEVQLTKLFQNLIDNAIKYSDSQKPEIEISYEEKGPEYMFAVADNGIGIEPEKQDEIFEVFKSIQPRENKGTGIGLASVKRIVERHNGEIWVESELGEGSTFYFTVPKMS